MRLLLYNPNTDKSLTARLAAAARPRLRADDVLKVATADHGSAFIGSEDSIAAARALLAADLARHGRESDAILLGCFGDLGIDIIRRELRRPIISLSDAFFATAPFLGKRLAVVTTSPFWASRLAVEAHQNHTARWVAEIRSLDVESAVSLETQCRAEIAEIARDGRSDVVVLGGSVLIALEPQLTLGGPLPIADSLAAAVGLCRTAHESLGAAVDANEARRPRSFST